MWSKLKKIQGQMLSVNPPPWYRVLLVVTAIVLTVAMWARRGWVFGLVTLLIYGAVLGSTAISGKSPAAWSRSHPVLDGLVLGPLVFVAIGYITPLSLGWCVLIGLAAGGIGALLGLRQARLQTRR